MRSEISIGIVGGSIAGCTMGVLLQRLGFRVHVFERSSKLKETGAGITLPVGLVQQCIALDLMDEDIPRLTAFQRSFLRKNSKSLNDAQQFWQQPVHGFTLSWKDVHQNLYKRLNPAYYHRNTEISNMDNRKNHCRLVTSTGEAMDFDFVIAADGVDSFIRRTLLPEAKPNYAEYVAWRGLIGGLPSHLSNLFAELIPYYTFRNGHILLYRIPGEDYQNTGSTLLNWVLYECMPRDRLRELLVDKTNRQHTRSLPPGSLSSTHLQHLHELAQRVLPDPIASLIQRTPQPFLQAVFDFQIPAYQHEHIIFSGDAAITLRPHTASGVMKALMNGIDFATLLQENQSIPLTMLIKQWQHTQQLVGAEEIIKAKNMGQALVTQTPDWEKMDSNLMGAWWSSVMQGKNWYATQDAPLKT